MRTHLTHGRGGVYTRRRLLIAEGTMPSLRIQSSTIALVSALLLAVAAAGQTPQIPAAGLCNTGLTKASPPYGCTSSTLVTPVNPITGGDSVDGNWRSEERRVGKECR